MIYTSYVKFCVILLLFSCAKFQNLFFPAQENKCLECLSLHTLRNWPPLSEESQLAHLWLAVQCTLAGARWLN